MFKVCKPIFIAIFFILLLGGGILLLASHPFFSKGQSESNILRICSANWIPQKFQLAKVIKEFEKENPGIKVTLEQYDELASYCYPLMNQSNQTKYDLFLGSSREHIVSYVSQGLLDDFEDGFFDTQFKKEDFFPSFLELGNINGKQYMIPLMGELMVLVIRKDLFQKNGLIDQNGRPLRPQNWDELLSDAKKLTTVSSKGEKTYGISIDFGNNMLLNSLYSSLQAERGSIFDDKTLNIDVSSRDLQDIMEKWQQLVKEGWAPTYTFENMDAGRENFKAGKVAMLLAPHSRWVECAAILGADKVGVLPLPGADKNGSLTYIHGIAVAKNSPHRALAIKFIKEKLLNRSFQTWSMENYGKIPSLIRNYDAGLSPDWKFIFTSLQEAITLPIYKDWPKFDKVLQRETQNYIIGRQTIQTTIAKLTAELAKIDKSTGLGL